MRERPVYLTIMASLNALVAVSFPVQVMLLYGHPPAELLEALKKLTVLNWLVIGVCVACAPLFWRASSRLRWAVPALFLSVAVNNFFVGYYAVDFSATTAGLATVGFAALALPLLRGELRELLRHPERRWWLIPERKRAKVPIVLGEMEGFTLSGETFDVSASGAFVPLASVRARLTEDDWEEPLSLRLSLGAQSAIRCRGRVVRKADAKGNYPAGIGIEFVDMSWLQKMQLKRYLAHHPSPQF